MSPINCHKPRGIAATQLLFFQEINISTILFAPTEEEETDKERKKEATSKQLSKIFCLDKQIAGMKKSHSNKTRWGCLSFSKDKKAIFGFVG